MTIISLAEWGPSPEIIVGRKEHRRLTIAAMTDIGDSTDRIDFLLYELDRARLVADAALPPDVVRIGSIVRYRTVPGSERTIKLVMPADKHLPGDYRLSVTSAHGAALLGLRPGHQMRWLDADRITQCIAVIKVANAPRHDDPPPRPDAA